MSASKRQDWQHFESIFLINQIGKCNFYQWNLCLTFFSLFLVCNHHEWAEALYFGFGDKEPNVVYLCGPTKKEKICHGKDPLLALV